MSFFSAVAAHAIAADRLLCVCFDPHADLLVSPDAGQPATFACE